MNLGNKIRELRRANNLTQEQLATSLNITAQAISKWEMGASYPDMTMIGEKYSTLLYQSPPKGKGLPEGRPLPFGGDIQWESNAVKKRSGGAFLSGDRLTEGFCKAYHRKEFEMLCKIQERLPSALARRSLPTHFHVSENIRKTPA